MVIDASYFTFGVRLYQNFFWSSSGMRFSLTLLCPPHYFLIKFLMQVSNPFSWPQKVAKTSAKPLATPYTIAYEDSYIENDSSLSYYSSVYRISASHSNFLHLIYNRSLQACFNWFYLMFNVFSWLQDCLVYWSPWSWYLLMVLGFSQFSRPSCFNLLIVATGQAVWICYWLKN